MPLMLTRKSYTKVLVTNFFFLFMTICGCDCWNFSIQQLINAKVFGQVIQVEIVYGSFGQFRDHHIPSSFEIEDFLLESNHRSRRNFQFAFE